MRLSLSFGPEPSFRSKKNRQDPHSGDTTPIVVCLQRRLDSRWDGERERQFFRHTQRYLASCTGNQIDVESWMITSYEVDFGPKIGVGGLYVHVDICLLHTLLTSHKLAPAGKSSEALGTKFKLQSRF